MSCPPSKRPKDLLSEAPSIETISDVPPNNSPCSYPVPKDQIYVEDHLVDQAKTTWLGKADVKTLLEKCCDEYIPNTTVKESHYCLDEEHIDLQLNDEQNCQVKGNLVNILRICERYAAKSSQGYFAILSRMIALKFGGIKTQEQTQNASMQAENMVFAVKNGVTRIYENEEKLAANSAVDIGSPTCEEFVSDLKFICAVAADENTKIFCEKRLRHLSHIYNSHAKKHGSVEEKEIVNDTNRKSFEKAVKVETHLHGGASMPITHLQEFIKKKLECDKRTTVTADGKTLGQLMQIALKKTDVVADEITVEELQVHPKNLMYRNFEYFNENLVPAGSTEVKKVFLKVENFMDGVYFAEILKEVIENMKVDSTARAEIRLSLSGGNKDELDVIAKWWHKNGLHDDRIKWILQVPRKFSQLYREEKVGSFHEMMGNVFFKMFEASKDPENHTELDLFMTQIVGIDLVDKEDIREFPVFSEDENKPEEWTNPNEPPYLYYLYYCFANLCHLNKYRSWRNKNTFSFRPHCGESGALEHLIGGFLLGESICHGLQLCKLPVIQYAFFVTQMGISMSPTSNNWLFQDYRDQPLRKYIERGLRVCIGSDDPLVFSYTKQPLKEEALLVQNVFKLTRTEVLEILQNAAIICGFMYSEKIQWIGKFDDYAIKTVTEDTLVPSTRLNFRLHDQLLSEIYLIFS